MIIKNLNDLFLHELQRTHAATVTAAEALPRLMARAEPGALSIALDPLLTDGSRRAENLELIFGALSNGPGAASCLAMEGRLKDAEKLVDAIDDGPTRLRAIEAVLTSVSRDLRWRFATLAEWAGLLHLPDAARLLVDTLEDDDRTGSPPRHQTRPETRQETRQETPRTRPDGPGNSGGIGMGDRLTALFERKK